MLHNNPVKTVDLAEAVSQDKILTSLDLSGNEDALAYQQQAAGNLVRAFTKGGKGVKSDKWKAKAYAKQFIALNKKLGNTSLPQDIREKADLADTNARTGAAFNAFGWFNDTRLLAVRIAALAEAIKGPFLGFAGTVLSWMGFGYAIRLMFDISIVIKGIVSPDSEEEKALSYWERFKAVMKNNNRAYRMANDALWLAINVTAFVFSGGLSVAGMLSLSVLVNIGGFIFDSIVEFTKWSEVATHQRALAAAKDNVRAIEENPEWIKMQTDLRMKKDSIKALDDYYYSCTNNEDRKLVAATVDALKNDIAVIETHPLVRERNKWSHIADKLTAKTAEVRKARLKELAMVGIICIGMVLAMTPFTMPIGIVILAASVSLLTGSIFTGIGERIAGLFKKAPAEKETGVAIEKQPLLRPNANTAVSRMRSSSVSFESITQAANENTIDVSVNASPSKKGMFARRMSDPSGMKVNMPAVAFRL